jgi:FkbM family methyltransferase
MTFGQPLVSQAMIVNVKHVFMRLLPAMKIGTICDVGSMDGADAMRFRSFSPEAVIYAFEPNPENLSVMERNDTLRDRHIHVVPCAVGDCDGEADFFVVPIDPTLPDPRRGWSSLHRRSTMPTSNVRVNMVRLDNYFAGKVSPETRFALWIDAEGKGFEVIEGMRGIAAQVYLVHVEVESTGCIHPEQRLYPDVKRLLQELGFRELATDAPAANVQFNALFARADLPSEISFRIRLLLTHAWVRRRIGSLVARFCPACYRRYRHHQLASQR